MGHSLFVSGAGVDGEKPQMSLDIFGIVRDDLLAGCKERVST